LSYLFQVPMTLQLSISMWFLGTFEHILGAIVWKGLSSILPHVLSTIIFSINTFCFSLKAFTVNKANIVYQYSSLCGPDFYVDSENVWSFPENPEEYQMCSRCTRNKKCPDIYGILVHYVCFVDSECIQWEAKRI
jgi:hypothetical protein